MNISCLRQYTARLLTGSIIGCLLVTPGRTMAQTVTASDRQVNYIAMLRTAADSVLRLPVESDARLHYFHVTIPVYDKALIIAEAEAVQQKGTANADFANTMVQLVVRLRHDLNPPNVSQGAIPLSSLIKQNTNAAVGNFLRYQQPAGLDHEQQYLWVMIQVFENLNQINIAYMQAGLTEAEKNAVLKRLNVQRQMIVQLRSKYQR